MHKAQRGLFFGKPKFGIFVLARYKEGLDVDQAHSGIVTAACDVIKYALKLEESSGSGKDEIFTESKRLLCLKIDKIRAVATDFRGGGPDQIRSTA